MLLSEEEIIKQILDESFYLHKSVGPGLLEKVYRTCLAYLLRKKGLYVETERPIPVIYKDVTIECGYRADLVVEHKIVVETKKYRMHCTHTCVTGFDSFTVFGFEVWAIVKF